MDYPVLRHGGGNAVREVPDTRQPAARLPLCYVQPAQLQPAQSPVLLEKSRILAVQLNLFFRLRNRFELDSQRDLVAHHVTAELVGTDTIVMTVDGLRGTETDAPVAPRIVDRAIKANRE